MEVQSPYFLKATVLVMTQSLNGNENINNNLKQLASHPIHKLMN